MPPNTKQRSGLLLLLSLLILLSAVPLDVMLPSFPALAEHFVTDTNDIALSISTFTLGFSITQLLVGPLSDRYGRKRLLIIGLALALTGSSGCIFATNYASFIFFRIIQSIGCAAFVLAQAIVQDAFKGDAGVRMRIFTTALSGIFIACSPLLGSVLQDAIGWEGSFILFSALSLIILIQVIIQFEETCKANHGDFIYYSTAYLKILGSLKFLSYSVIGALAFSCHLAFIIVSPTIFLVDLKMDNYRYSGVLLLYGAAYVIGGYAASYVAKRMETYHQIRIGLVLMTLSGAIMLAMWLYTADPVLTVILPMLVCTAGTVLIRPATATEAMSLFDEMAGTASAAGSTIRFATAGVISAAISKLGTDATANLCLAVILSSCVSFFVFAKLGEIRPSRAGAGTAR